MSKYKFLNKHNYTYSGDFGEITLYEIFTSLLLLLIPIAGFGVGFLALYLGGKL